MKIMFQKLIGKVTLKRLTLSKFFFKELCQAMSNNHRPWFKTNKTNFSNRPSNFEAHNQNG